MINKKLIHFNTYSAFEANKSQLYDWTIAFIGETKQIYTHGNFYDCNIDDINTLQDAIDAINEALGQLSESKQDVISDLDAIRNGAELGATALQSVPSEYVTESELTDKGYTTNTGTVTSVTAGTGLTGGTISTSGTIALGDSGATAGSYGPSADVNGSNGATMSVPYVTVDQYGRVTAISNKTYTSVNTTYSAMTASVATAGTDTSARTISAKVLHDKIVDTAVVNDGNILNIAKVSSLPSSPDANTLYVIV